MYKFVALLMLLSSSAFAYPVQDTGSDYVLHKFDSMLLEIKKLVHEAIAPKVLPNPVVHPTDLSDEPLPPQVFDVVEKIVETALVEILETPKEPEVVAQLIPVTVQEVHEVQEEEVQEDAQEVTEVYEDKTDSSSDEKIAVEPTVETFTEEVEEKTDTPVTPVIVEHVPDIQMNLEIVTELQPPHHKIIVDDTPESPFNEIVNLNEPLTLEVIPEVFPDVQILPVSVPEKVVVPNVPVEIPEVVTSPVKVPEEIEPVKVPQEIVAPVVPVKQTVKRVKNSNKIKKFVQKKTPVVV